MNSVSSDTLPPCFSVVIAAYNAADYIGATIGSVIRQTKRNWQLVVVDDGSTDATREMVEQFCDERITLIRQENQGVSIARNRGLAAASGKYVLFLDADDLLFSDALSRLGRELDKHPEAVLAFGNCTRFETTPPQEAGARPPLRARPTPHGEAFAALITRNRLFVGGALARRKVLAHVDGFDPSLRIGEDWVFWCSVAAMGPIRHIGRKPVLAYRCRQGSATRMLAANPKGFWPAIDRIFAQEAVAARFSARELARLRRRAEAYALCIASRELLRVSDWRQARAILWEALKRDPASFGDWFFLPFALVGWLPRPARRLLD
jgi:glycosyltransferase involved in cell wall biosynthesis